MGFLEGLRKKRAIKGYIKKLPGLLARDYGKTESYTPRQVQRAVERHNLHTAYTPFAMAMFTTREEYIQYQEGFGETADYDTMRQEVADRHFEGDPDFDVPAIDTASGAMGGAEGPGMGDGGAGGGDGGGGGGGGP